MLNLDSRPTACSTAITVTAAALLGLGVVMVFSAGASLTAPSILDNPLEDRSVRQAMFACAALLVLLVAGLCRHDIWRIRRKALAPPSVVLLLISLALLSIVLIPGIGENRNGAQRWLSLSKLGLDIGFQPSEIAKLALVIFGAAYCA